MRLACISTILGYPWGSPDRLWTEVAKRFLARGDEVFLGLSPLTAEHPEVRQLQGKGAEIFVRAKNSVYSGRRDGFLRKLPWRRDDFLESRLSIFSPDIVLITQGATYDCLAEYHLIAWLRATGTPFVVVCHNNPDGPGISADEASQVNEFFAMSARTLFVSSHNRLLAERHLDACIPRSCVIQNPLSPGRALPWPEPGSSRPTIGMVGRLDVTHKGLDLLFEALAELPSPRPRLVMTGRMEDQKRLDHLLAVTGMAPDVEFRGPIPADQICQAFGEIELFLLTSRYEGCASAMLEAMRAGRPVLATPVGGVHDWIVDGEHGYITSDVSAQAIHTTFVRALAERRRWPEMGAAAQQVFSQRCDADPIGTLLGFVDAAALASA